jgi:hypothetical protein
VFLMTDDPFVAWSNNPSNFHTTWHGFRASDLRLDYQLYGAGTYYLIISNAFSAVTSKTVEIQALCKSSALRSCVTFTLGGNPTKPPNSSRIISVARDAAAVGTITAS